jgi:predicted P-loop ATPase
MSDTLPATKDQANFPDIKIIGQGDSAKVIRLPTYANALVALDVLGVECRYDVFHDRRYIGGELLSNQVGQVTDDVCLLIRALCRDRCGFDPGKDHTWDAVNFKCRLNSYHPVRDYLDKCEQDWDFTPRIDTWMTDYLGVPDSPLTRAMSRLVLVASVRRVKQPGCKYDYMIVLVGPENKAKSLSIATLYGDENFSDQKIIGISDKELAEAVRGRWGIESAELAGLRKADIDHLKAQITRQVDRVRPAYGRSVIDAPREFVFWGTTNDPIFLREAHGNRRFVPLTPGKIDIAALARDRDQLWAEAVYAEIEHGPSLALPEAVWIEAQAAQGEHTERDPWIDDLENVTEWATETADATRAKNDKLVEAGSTAAPEPILYERNDFRGDERIATSWLLNVVLTIPKDRQSPQVTHRLATIMQKLGWSAPMVLRIGGRNHSGYKRALPDAG